MIIIIMQVNAIHAYLHAKFTAQWRVPKPPYYSLNTNNNNNWIFSTSGAQGLMSV
jgi:hypothetical protein